MKNRKLSIRISEENLNSIHLKAAKAKLTFTDYVTRACLGKQIFVIDGLNEILSQQKAIGRNINQITMLSHMGRLNTVNFEELKNEFIDINKKLSLILERKRWSDGNS